MDTEFKPIVTEYVTISEEEFTKFSMHAYRDLFKLYKWILIGGVPIFIAGFIIPNFYVVWAGLFFMGMGLGVPLYMKEWLKKSYKDPKNVWVRSPSRAVISDDTIEFESENGSKSSTPWSNFVKIEELGGAYMLYVARYMPVVMFPRAQSEQDWKGFVALVEQKKLALEKHS
jgi:hypothetical protein